MKREERERRNKREVWRICDNREEEEGMRSGIKKKKRKMEGDERKALEELGTLMCARKNVRR